MEAMARMELCLGVGMEGEDRGRRYPAFPGFPLLQGLEVAVAMQMEEGEVEFSSTEVPPDHTEGTAMEVAVATGESIGALEISVVVGRVWMELSSSTLDTLL